MKKMIAMMIALAMVLSLAVPAFAEAANFEGMTVEEIQAKAKEDGHLETVGMPDDWANWADSWAGITEQLGITHYDTDMTSAEELAIMAAEGVDGTKDLGDVGINFLSQAIDQGLLQGYKVSTWDSIPDWAKDPEGRWYISYTGTMTFCVNKTLADGVVPQTWQELMDSGLRVSVGNVSSGAASQVAVLCAAYAMGGDMNNVMPGIEYFVKLAEEGRLDPGDTTSARMENGEMIVCASLYDFSTLPLRDRINASDAGYEIVVTVPQDGAITTGYGQIFNVNAPHPYAAAAALEYLLSDAGQIDRANGYARPIRTDVELPAEVQAKVLDNSLYEHTIPVDDVELFKTACAQIAQLWEEEVVPLMY